MLGDYAKVAPVGMICRGDRQKDAEAASPTLAGLKGKLSNENFVSRAPEAVVQAERDKLSKAESLLQQLQESQARLKK